MYWFTMRTNQYFLEGGGSWACLTATRKSVSGSKAFYYLYLHFTFLFNTINHKRTLTPKSMPPTGDEQAKTQNYLYLQLPYLYLM